RPTENICGNSTCLKTPQYFKEGRLKPFFANNVDIPFARARRLKPCPRKATKAAFFIHYASTIKTNAESAHHDPDVSRISLILSLCYLFSILYLLFVLLILIVCLFLSSF